MQGNASNLPVPKRSLSWYSASDVPPLIPSSSCLDSVDLEKIICRKDIVYDVPVI